MPFAGGLKALTAINEYWEHLKIYLVDCIRREDINEEYQQEMLDVLKDIEKKLKKAQLPNAKKALKKYSAHLKSIEGLIESRKKGLG